MPEHIIKVQSLQKEYSGKRVLDIENLEIEKGKITAVIGPSGAGKSTLLHLLNEIEAPSSGTIWFEGKRIDDKTMSLELRRKMVMVFQRPLVFNTTVYDNLAYGLKLRGMRKEEIRKRVEEMLEVTGLKDKSQQKAITLSGGEAQRVAIGRAIIIRPEVLFLDEPTANLDPANISMIEELIKYARDNYKLTVMIITHNMFQAKRLSDNTVFMLNGKVVEFNSTENLFTKPQNYETKAFIEGKMIF